MSSTSPTSRVNWTCPGCGKVYAVPSIAGLTVCPKCQQKLADIPAAPRSSVNGFLWAWILWTVVCASYVANMMLSVMSSAGTSNKALETAASAVSIVVFVVVLPIYIGGTAVIALVKFISSRKKP